MFALVNLPEVVKGALFARYSRSPKSLRRLFLDEFVGDLDVAGDQTIDATIGLRRAEELYEKVFLEYGDDSVAQLGGVHLACEQASNLLTKVLEWGRLMSYLEQSTRYIAYDARLGGRYRYYRDPAVLASRLGTRYVGDMDRMFDAYSRSLDGGHRARARHRSPAQPDDSDFVYRQATRAKALDAVRGMLPAASLSNVGIYGTGQAFEALLLRMRAHPLPEARELRRADAARAAQGDPELPAPRRPPRPRRPVERVPRHDPRAHRRARRLAVRRRRRSTDAPTRARSSTGIPTPRTSCSPRSATRTPTCPSTQLLERVRRLGADERVALVRAYVGERENRRHKPGRAFERIDYRFDVLSDYGAFRDLQRHRLLTIEWQRADAAPRLRAPRARRRRRAGRRCSTRRWPARPRCTTRCAPTFPEQAPYAVAMAYRLRYVDAVQRPRGDAHARAALGAAGPSGLPPGGARDAPPDRRAGRPPRRRRGDDPPHDRGARARAPRVRAPGRGPPGRLTRVDPS